MEMHLVVAPVFGTNCTVVVADDDPGAGPGAGPGALRDCVVVDPGAGVADEVSDLVARLHLRPRAVLATHGHVDHTWDAAALCGRYGVPLRIHTADAYRLDDPFGSLGIGGAGVSSALTAALAAAGRHPRDYRSPQDVVTFAPGPDGEVLRAGAVSLRALHAPGHTQGSTLLVSGGSGGRPGVVLAGDVLFAGGVGRTDLPGGDPATMARTLRDVVGRLDRDLGVVPGHGPTTAVGHELDTNPFLG